MYTFVTPLRPEDIYHHGTKGMHWGVKNGPPYPIGNLQKKTSSKILRLPM
jgi:hypothetical protein